MNQTSKTLTDRPKRDLSAITVILLTAVLIAGMSVISDTFFTYDNLYSILYGVSFQFLAIIGFTCLMIMGEIDLSAGAMYGFSGMLVGWLMLKQDMPMWVSILIALIICTSMGLLTGLLVVKLRLNSMMVTIATMTLIAGLGSNLVKSLTGTTYPSAFRALPRANIGGVHFTVIAMIFLAITLEILLKRSTIFKKCIL